MRSLTEALKSGPKLLFLGQSYLGVFGVGPFFEAFLDQRLADSPSTPPYERWLSVRDAVESRGNIWQETSDKVTLSPALVDVATIPWSGVLTSAIDDVLRRALSVTPARSVRPVFPRTAGSRLIAGRNPVPFVLLFGSVNRQTREEQPPHDRAMLRERRSDVASLFLTLPEAIGPKGVFIVDGWRSRSDWIRPRDLAPALLTLGPGQVHIFSCDEAERAVLNDDEDLADLVTRGVIECHEEPFLVTLEAFRQSGELPREWELDVEEGTLELVLRGARDSEFTLKIQGDDWRQFNRHFHVLSRETNNAPAPRSPTEKYEAFRELLRSGQLHHRWRDVQELGFRRHFLSALHKIAKGMLTGQRPQDETLIVVGQAGSGKSMALAQLALELSSNGFAVIYVPDGALDPDVNQIDRFCLFVENAAAEANENASIAVIWDGLRDAFDYGSVSEHLAARGRRVLVIGSTYYVHSALRKKGKTRNKEAAVRARYRVFDIDITMGPEERKDFAEHLNRIIPGIERDLALEKVAIDGNLLASLYRFLPTARGPIDRALLRELREAEDRLRLAADDESVQTPLGYAAVAETVMGVALLSALRGSYSWLLDTPPASNGVRIDHLEDAEKLIALVMCAGQFGVSLPQNLLLQGLTYDLR